MYFKIPTIFFFFLYFPSFAHPEDGSCFADKNSVSCKTPLENRFVSRNSNRRYILYEVNPGEGFNLRRDVYMRVATMVKKLNEDSEFHQWVLVLPPWGPLYHWKSKTLGFQAQIKWSKFFDVSSLAMYVPVMEFEEYLSEQGSEIDVIYYLQHYAEGWDHERWEEKIDIRECIEASPFTRTSEGTYVGWFWGFRGVTAKEHHCLSVQGYGSTLKKFLSTVKAKTVMIDRAEVILHDSFGDVEYWKVRQSMVFSKELIDIGNSFRKEFLNSTDEHDKTGKRSSSSDIIERGAVGGPYIGVHLRRRDFSVSRTKDVPSIKYAAEQISIWMKRLNLQMVFVATDAPETEFMEFQQIIPSAVHFMPDKKLHKKILDGGVAIVDQWICAHSRFFIGTYESTFSFRIHEEREILGFPVDATFNRLCGDNQTSCQQPAKWTMVLN